MVNLSPLRWGEPYESLDFEEIRDFITGEPVARVGLTGAGIVRRDSRKAAAARESLLAMEPAQLIACCQRAGELFESGTLTVGDASQSPADFIEQQSATTGMPHSMCEANLGKNAFVLKNIDKILEALTRGLDLNILAQGYGDEGRNVTVSYQAQTDVLAAVLPNNSPGVHTLWLPVVALQMGLALKPGSQEPWTPYRVAAAMMEAGIPAAAFSLYPGKGAEVGGALLSSYRRSMIFGGEQTIQQYAGNPGVQVHGPGFSKILLGDDVVDDWEKHVDLMVDSVYRNGGRSCINCSSIYAARHTEEIAAALAERLGPIAALPPEDPAAGLAAFTNADVAEAIWKMVVRDAEDAGTTHVTESYGERFDRRESCAYLRPTVLHCQSPDCSAANKEYMFPLVSVVKCEQSSMLSSIGPTLVATAITGDEGFRRQLIAATHIDRLNLGPIPTPQLDWLQPHEGNLTELLYRNRALQVYQE